MPGDRARSAAFLDGKLYVVSFVSDRVRVFADYDPFEQLDEIVIRGLRATDIVACGDLRRLYVADVSGSGCIWRVDSPSNLVYEWIRSDGQYLPCSLSVGAAGRLLVCPYRPDDRLFIYNADGHLAKTVRMAVGVGFLRHAVETVSGTLIVGYYGLLTSRMQRQHAVLDDSDDSSDDDDDSRPQVVGVDDDGNVMRSYFGRVVGGPRLKDPCYLVSCPDGRVIVADSIGRRALLLNSQLQFERVLLSRRRNELSCGLERLCYVSQSRRLFAVLDDGCVNVYDW
jgi:hypothetical protein